MICILSDAEVSACPAMHAFINSALLSQSSFDRQYSLYLLPNTHTVAIWNSKSFAKLVKQTKNQNDA